jgi:hypothetical protein
MAWLDQSDADTYDEHGPLPHDIALERQKRGSFFIIATATPSALIYDRMEGAVDWADDHVGRGAEIFVGMNPRTSEGKGKDAVGAVTACYVDLDLPEGLDREEDWLE